MIPKILHQSSKYFTWEECRLARRAQEIMEKWTYHAWTDEDNLALVEKICPSHVKEYFKLPNGSVRADIARYLYMYQYGGVYFDTDYRLFQPIKEDWLSYVCILGIEDEDAPELGGGPKLGNAFIGSEPGLALWTEFIDDIFMRFRKGWINPDTTSLGGPQALTRFLRNHKQYAEVCTILPRNVLYPRQIRFNLTGARDPETIGVHLCWSSWRYMSLPHKVKNKTRRILSALA